MRHSIARIASVSAALTIIALAPVAHAVVASIDSVAGRVLIKRGDAYLPVGPAVALEPSDDLVLVEGASVTVSCGGAPFETFDKPGVYGVPECPAVAAEEGTSSDAGANGNANTSANASANAPGGGTTQQKSGVTPGGVTLGAAALATVVVAASQSGGGGDGKPASP